jgi:hypothetical protein
MLGLYLPIDSPGAQLGRQLLDHDRAAANHIGASKLTSPPILDQGKAVTVRYSAARSGMR